MTMKITNDALNQMVEQLEPEVFPSGTDGTDHSGMEVILGN